MFLGNNIVLVFIVLSAVLVFIGFGFRSHNGGVLLLGLGLLIALALIIRKAVETFG